MMSRESAKSHQEILERPETFQGCRSRLFDVSPQDAGERRSAIINNGPDSVSVSPP
jgi:hypothetical protein